MPRNVPLTDAQKFAIKSLRKDCPGLTLREIGSRFNVTPSCVCMVLGGQQERHKAHPKEPTKGKVVMLLPKAEEPESFISPIPKSALMSGNARRSIRAKA